MADKLYIVVPCYNEEAVLPETAARLGEKLRVLISRGIVSPHSRILFVDDGSKDATWPLVEALHREDSLYAGLALTRNRGHQNALLAGLHACATRCDVCISMDADLQDDIDAVDAMLEKYRDGCDIDYGVREDRATDTLFKRGTAQWYYRLMRLMGADLIYNHADYRLMSRRALEGLASFNEVNLFLRGIVPMIGYQTGTVTYRRGERFAGESKYPLKKMLSFGWDGITSFSFRPIRLITILGFVIFAASFLLMAYSVVSRMMGWAEPGWPSLMVSIWMLGGLQLLSLGVIGEYIGKIYIEVKARPKYLVRELLDDAGPVGEPAAGVE